MISDCKSLNLNSSQSPKRGIVVVPKPLQATKDHRLRFSMVPLRERAQRFRIQHMDIKNRDPNSLNKGLIPSVESRLDIPNNATLVVCTGDSIWEDGLRRA